MTVRMATRYHDGFEWVLSATFLYYCQIYFELLIVVLVRNFYLIFRKRAYDFMELSAIAEALS